MTKKAISKIRDILREKKPFLTKNQMLKKYKARNPDNPNYIIYGIKMKDIETIAKTVYSQYNCSMEEAIAVFNSLIASNIAEEKFAALYFLNCYKKTFNEEIIDLFYEAYSNHCNTWALCDSTCLKVLGPFLYKQGNLKLAKSTIEKWSDAESIWIRRASLVLLLKLIMLKKDYYLSKSFFFDLVEKMLHFKEDYIQKAIGWLLKTCSKYKQYDIINFLDTNKQRLPKLILRYASEKLPGEIRSKLLTK